MQHLYSSVLHTCILKSKVLPKLPRSQKQDFNLYIAWMALTSKGSWTVFYHWWHPSLHGAQCSHSHLREPTFLGERWRCHNLAAQVRRWPQTFQGRTTNSPKSKAKMSPLGWGLSLKALYWALDIHCQTQKAFNSTGLIASLRGAVSLSPVLCVT